jgi:hypothetical protein
MLWASHTYYCLFIPLSVVKPIRFFKIETQKNYDTFLSELEKDQNKIILAYKGQDITCDERNLFEDFVDFFDYYLTLDHKDVSPSLIDVTEGLFHLFEESFKNRTTYLCFVSQDATYLRILGLFFKNRLTERYYEVKKRRERDDYHTWLKILWVYLKLIKEEAQGLENLDPSMEGLTPRIEAPTYVYMEELRYRTRYSHRFDPYTM